MTGVAQQAWVALDAATSDLLCRVYALSSLAESYRHLVDQASDQRDPALSWVFVVADHAEQLSLASERLQQVEFQRIKPLLHSKRVQGGNPGEQAKPRDN